MKRILLLACFFVLFTIPVYAASFPDVPEDHENYGAIEYLDENGVLNGYDDGTFKPDDPVNRAEAAKIIVNAFSIANDEAFSEIFPDVPANEWFFDFVMAGQNAGILDGYDDGTFKPGDNVNLAETLKMIILASNETLPETVENDVFMDVPASEWYAPHAYFAREHNIVLADDYGQINAAQDMTRAYFSEVIYRMMIVMQNDSAAYPLYTNWPYYESDFLPFKIKYDSEDWQVIEYGDEIVFMKPDKEFLQFSPGRIYPNTGLIRVTVDENEMELSESQYFENIKLAFANAEYTIFSLDGFSAMEVLYPKDRIVDWYVYLDNNSVLVLYTQYGSGLLGYQLQRIMKSMLSTLEYKEVSAAGGNDYSELLSEIFENVLVEGKGREMLDKLPDKLIIETDAIGVGTGPVDYYYSETVDYTFKYERDADVILDTREGNTTAF